MKNCQNKDISYEKEKHVIDVREKEYIFLTVTFLFILKLHQTSMSKSLIRVLNKIIKRKYSNESNLVLGLCF